MTSFRLLCILGASLLAGCVKGHMPIDPDNIDRPDKIQSGPGLLTGEEGGFKYAF